MRFLVRSFLQMIQFLGAVVGNYGWKQRPSSNAHDLLKAAWIAEYIEDQSCVLDVGGGNGRRLSDLSLFVRELYGVSIDVYEPDTMTPPLDHMKKPKISIFDGKSIPVLENDFDVILICYVLHHLSEPHSQKLLSDAANMAQKRVIILEDSRPFFGLSYRLRNWAHATESNLLYEKRSSAFTRNFLHSFKTHSQWVKTLEAIPNVTKVECIPLDPISKYRHHAMFVVDL